MKAAGLLIMLLSNQGYWTGGDPGTLTAAWSAKEGVPQAQLRWQLMIDSVILSRGIAELPAAAAAEASAPATGKLDAATRASASASVAIKTPAVRARTKARIAYVLKSAEGTVLQSGDIPILLFPANASLTANWKRLVGERRLIVCDQGGNGSGLAKLLTSAGVRFVAFDNARNLAQAPAADVLLVGQNQLGDSLDEQTPLLALARSGCSVMVFQQDKPKQLASFAVESRPAPPKVQWEVGHPLLASFSEEDLQSWLAPYAASQPSPTHLLRALHVPADAAVLKLAQWPREPGSAADGPHDSLALTQTLGRGRLVLFQIPLGPWETDPRSVLLLGDSLDYLLSPPQRMAALRENVEGREGKAEPEPNGCSLRSPVLAPPSDAADPLSSLLSPVSSQPSSPGRR